MSDHETEGGTKEHPVAEELDAQEEAAEEAELRDLAAERTHEPQPLEGPPEGPREILNHLIFWMGRHDLPDPETITIQILEKNLSFTYNVERLTGPDRRAVKREFGPFKKGYGEDVVTAWSRGIRDGGPWNGWRVTATLKAAYECTQVCVPKTTFARQALEDLDVTERD